MLSEEAIKTIRNALKFKYDEHISRLLVIPKKHLDKIIPNKGLPIVEVLQGLNADTTEEVRRYGEVLQAELVRKIERIGISDFTKEDHDLIIQLLEDYCSPDLYKKRFKIMLGSIERKIKGYGIAFDITNYRVDIPKSCCDVGSENLIRNIKAIISNELNCHIVRNQSKPDLKVNNGSQHITAKRSKLTVLKKVWSDPVLSKVIATIILTIGGLCLAWLHNKPNKNHEAALRIPPVVVEIRNSSKKAIAVASRGDFFLWLPGPDAQHTFGKYEFHTLKDSPLESEVFTVDPTAQVKLLAHIMNQDFYGKMLNQADCDIALMVRKANGGHRTTENLPFTKEAINKYFTSVDIGTD